MSGSVILPSPRTSQRPAMRRATAPVISGMRLPKIWPGRRMTAGEVLLFHGGRDELLGLELGLGVGAAIFGARLEGRVLVDGRTLGRAGPVDD